MLVHPPWQVLHHSLAETTFKLTTANNCLTASMLLFIFRKLGKPYMLVLVELAVEELALEELVVLELAALRGTSMIHPLILTV